MGSLALWFAFVGSWLLFVGPLHQGSTELWELGRRGTAMVRLTRWDRLLWLAPPLLYVVQLRRIRQWQAAAASAADGTGENVTDVFTNRATGWFSVSGGALLIAGNEAWNLAEHYELGTAGYWAVVAGLVVAAVGYVAVRMNVLIRRTMTSAESATTEPTQKAPPR